MSEFKDIDLITKGLDFCKNIYIKFLTGVKPNNEEVDILYRIGREIYILERCKEENDRQVKSTK